MTNKPQLLENFIFRIANQRRYSAYTCRNYSEAVKEILGPQQLHYVLFVYGKEINVIALRTHNFHKSVRPVKHEHISHPEYLGEIVLIKVCKRNDKAQENREQRAEHKRLAHILVTDKAFYLQL